ncbi:MAG: hypothetical protein ACXABD_19165 [Candidatus Thorarchaeota archaeon]|jgi:hypothetical protein
MTARRFKFPRFVFDPAKPEEALRTLLIQLDTFQNWIIAQEAWTAVGTFLNSWVNYGGTYGSAGYYRDAFDVVRLRGVVKDGTVGAAGVIFALPVGYRPEEDRVFANYTDSGVGRVEIESGGDVIAKAGGNTWFSLDGISFRVKEDT